MNVSNCSIFDLPVEIILTIFEFLDVKSRTEVSATCKSWKCLAESCFKWPLFLNALPFITAEKELFETKRKFFKIYIKGEISGEIYFLHVLEFLRQVDTAFLSAITEMTISCVTFQLTQFNNLLKMFPNLNNLELHEVNMLRIDRDVQLKDHEKPNFQKLQKLFICSDTNSELLQCFTNAKLMTLICRHQHFTSNAIWSFLSTQKGLKEIDFCRAASGTTFEFGVDPSKATFKLKRLALDYKSVSDFNGMMDLVLLQPNDIETVEFGHIPDLSVYSIIFSNLKNLKTLHLMPGCVGMNLINHLQLESLPSVTSLRLYDGINYGFDLRSIESFTIRVIENVPNLEHLELFVPYDQIFYQAITTNLKKLKSLTIRVTFDTKLKNLKFPAVVSLRINCFNTRKYKVKHRPISMLRRGETQIHGSIRSLTFDGTTNDKFFDLIRKNFPMLQLLEVRKDLAKVEHACVSDIRQVHYRDNDFFFEAKRFEH